MRGNTAARSGLLPVRFQIQEGPYRIQTGVWKFNQYYTCCPAKRKIIIPFCEDECLPEMKKLGIPITAGWRLVVAQD